MHRHDRVDATKRLVRPHAEKAGLVTAARVFDADRAARVMHAELPRVVSTYTRRFGNALGTAEVEDAAGDAVVSILHEQVATTDEEVRRHLYRKTHSALLNALKSPRHAARVELDEAAVGSRSLGADPGESVAELDVLRQAMRLAAALPSEQREFMEMGVFGGAKPAAVMRATGWGRDKQKRVARAARERVFAGLRLRGYVITAPGAAIAAATARFWRALAGVWPQAISDRLAPILGEGTLADIGGKAIAALCVAGTAGGGLYCASELGVVPLAGSSHGAHHERLAHRRASNTTRPTAAAGGGPNHQAARTITTNATASSGRSRDRASVSTTTTSASPPPPANSASTGDLSFERSGSPPADDPPSGQQTNEFSGP